MTDTSYNHAIKLDNYRQTSINKGFDVSPDTIEEGQVMILRERHGEKAFFESVQASMIDFMMAAYEWLKVIPVEGPDAIDSRVRAMLEGEVKADEGISLVP